MTASVARAGTARPGILRRIGVVLAVLQAIYGIVSILSDFGTEGIALVVNVTVLVTAATALVGAVPAWLGRAWGVVLCAAGVLLMSLSGLPVFVVPGVPAEARVFVSVGIVVALITVVLLVLRPRR